MEILMHRYGRGGQYIETVESHSDEDVRLEDLKPPKRHVFAEQHPLPEFNLDTEMCFFRDGSWVVESKAFYEQPSSLHEWDGEKWTITLDNARLLKIVELANARWEVEVGGLILPNGVEVKTDRESQALLTGAALAALQDPEYSLNWKGSNGWVTLTAADVLGIANAVRAHVQWCFDREKSLVDLVGSAESAEEVQAIAW